MNYSYGMFFFIGAPGIMLSDAWDAHALPQPDALVAWGRRLYVTLAHGLDG